jgi:hypothetical protein
MFEIDDMDFTLCWMRRRIATLLAAMRRVQIRESVPLVDVALRIAVVRVRRAVWLRKS